MAGELVYTSVPKGLNRAESGFCVVARSAAISPLLLNRLEALSGYREIISAIDARANKNPVNFANTVVDCGNERFNIISRIGFAGLDYSGRSNKIADHLILTPSEVAGAGPAELLAVQELFHKKWDKAPVYLPENYKLIPLKPVITAPAEYWQTITGNSGWAEHLIELSRRNRGKPIYIITQLGVDNLTLVREALRLLPINEQWEYTFSTYCSSNIRDINYRWRFIYPGTDIYNKIKHSSHVVKLDLNNLPKELFRIGQNSVKNTVMSQPLRLSASMATIVPERYRFEPDYSPSPQQADGATKRRKLMMIFAVSIAVIMIGLLLYLFVERGNAITPQTDKDGSEPLTSSPVDSIETVVPSADEIIVDREQSKIVTESPLPIVLNSAERAQVKLQTPLSTLITLLNGRLQASSVELQFIINPELVKKICKKHGIEFNNQAVKGHGTIFIDVTKALKATLNELADNMDVDHFIEFTGNKQQDILVDAIKIQLAKSSGNNKNFYENSAEYVLGELYPKFKQLYMAFNIQRGAMIAKKNRLWRQIKKAKVAVKKYASELEDSGLENSKRKQFTDKLEQAKSRLVALQKTRAQLINQLENLKLPDKLKTYRDALLRTFFCFGKNYMAEAEDIIGFNKNSPDIKYIRTIVKKTKFSQQSSYENEFKMALNGYIYLQTMKKITGNAQAQLAKQRISLQYNRQNKLLNLIIEDDKNE